MLTYHARSASRAFWAEHWGGQSPEALARVAETSPLTDLIIRHLPRARSRVLEAGCGLGQYVVLLRARGHDAVGADWAVEPLRTCRAWTGDTPLAAMDLGQLAFAPGAFSAYVSLGVVEHDPAGPGRILAEAHRVLAAGGTLLVSVPYVNLARRLGARRIRRTSERIRAAGGSFYQFAFSRREATAAVERAGFRVIRTTPYDPARLLRRLWRRGRARRDGSPDGHDVAGLPAPGRAGRRPVRQLVRRLLYTPPLLHAFGHMLLVVAEKR
jgi:SAM-dependent methyltransferase